MQWGWKSLGMAGAAVLVGSLFVVAGAAAQREEHGRNWKPLPTESHIVVTVVKAFDGLPVANAGVVFHAVRDGKDDGNLEVKTDSDGRAVMDLVEVGSQVSIQVIARGFATAAQEMNVDSTNKETLFKLLRPRAQVSAFGTTQGPEKPAVVQPGIQQHIVPPAATAAAGGGSAAGGGAASGTASGTAK